MPVLEGIVREASSRGARYLETQSTVWMGSAMLADGDVAGAERRARRALGDAEDMGARVLLVQSHHLLAEILSGQGRVDEASRHAAKASEYLDQIKDETGTDSLLLRSDLRPIAE
jgi:ATP/maltotriose-dependent transcriptional regulator MalT